MPNAIINHDPSGMPYLDDDNYLSIWPAYTREFAAFLQTVGSPSAAVMQALADAQAVQAATRYGTWRLPANMVVAAGFRQLAATLAGTVEAGLATNAAGALTVTTAGVYILSANVIWGLQTSPACRLQTLLTRNTASINGVGILAAGEVLPGGSAISPPATVAGVGSSLAQSVVTAPFAAAAGDVLRVWLYSDLATGVNAGSANGHEGRTSISLHRVR